MVRRFRLILASLLLLAAISLALTPRVGAEEQVIKVLWDGYHDQYYNIEQYKVLVDHLSSVNVIVDGNDEPLTLDVLSEYDVLVIANPNAPLSEDELQAVKDFVVGGGGLILMGDVQYTSSAGPRKYGKPDNLNAVLEALGVVDRVSYWGTNDCGDEIKHDSVNVKYPWQVVVKKEYFKAHLISVGIEEVAINSALLSVTDPDVVIAVTDPGAYAEDVNGNVHAGGSLPWLAALEVGQGKVVVCGSSKMFSDREIYGTGMSYISYADNEKLFYNFLWWITGVYIAPPAKIEIFVPILDLFGLLAGFFAAYNFRGSMRDVEKYAVLVAVVYVVIAVVQVQVLGTVVFGIALPGWGRPTAPITSEASGITIPVWGVAAMRYFLAGLFEAAIGAAVFGIVMWVDKTYELGISKKIGYKS